MAVPIYVDDPEIPPDGETGGPSPNTPAGVPGYVIFEVAFQKAEADSWLKILAYASVVSGDDLIFNGYIAINGRIVQVCQVNIILDNQNSRGAMPMTLPAFVAGLPAGNHTITFSIRNFESYGPLTVLAGSTLEITELKRAGK